MESIYGSKVKLEVKPEPNPVTANPSRPVWVAWALCLALAATVAGLFTIYGRPAFIARWFSWVFLAFVVLAPATASAQTIVLDKNTGIPHIRAITNTVETVTTTTPDGRQTTEEKTVQSDAAKTKAAGKLELELAKLQAKVAIEQAKAAARAANPCGGWNPFTQPIGCSYQQLGYGYGGVGVRGSEVAIGADGLPVAVYRNNPQPLPRWGW